MDKIKALNPEGIILSGGPSSIYEENSPTIDADIFKLGIPILGICYGMQFMIHALGGTISRAEKREYGFATLDVKIEKHLFNELPSKMQVWMSHGDATDALPEGFTVTASTENTGIAAIADVNNRFYGLQFHPEVEHTLQGTEMIRNFLFDVCDCKKSWTMESFAAGAIHQIKESVGDKKVIMGLSGGVDSSVAALLIHKAVGKNLHCIFVDNGLLRKNEKEGLQKSLTAHLDMNISFVDERKRFLDALKDVTDPELKRKKSAISLLRSLKRKPPK